MTNRLYTNGSKPVFASSYVTPTQLLEVLFLPCHRCINMHTYVLVFKSFHETRLLDSLFFFVKGEMQNNFDKRCADLISLP